MSNLNEEISQRQAKAIALHNQGCNCAQSVILAFSDLTSIPEEDLFKISEGLGLGMGNMSGTCGALSGSVILTGILSSCGTPDKPTTKAKTYQLTKILMENFQKQNGSVICNELKGISTGKPLRSCPDCIKDACKFFTELYHEI